VQHILALLASLLALNGNQVMDLDYQAFQLGRDPHPELASIRAAQPFKDTNQVRNFAIVCATLDWNPTRFLSKKPANPDVGRLFAAEYATVPSSATQLAFLRTYADQWRTNWEAGPAEEGVLTRLSVQDPEKAQVFADKLLSNPKNLPYTQWYHWSLLMSERRKEEAQQFATEHHIDKAIMASSRYPLPSYMPMKMQIAWPRVARTDTYTYFFGQKTWAPAVIPKQNKPVYISSEWNPPSGSHYSRSWQRGPSWQVTYARDGSWLVRTATYVERNSHVEGKIDGNNVSEEIVEELQEPAGFYYVTPTFVLVQH